MTNLNGVKPISDDINNIEKLLSHKASLTHFRPMFHLRTNQVVDFYQQNVWKTPVEEWHFKTCIFTQNVTLPQVFFKHFASKNQLPGFYISGTLVENGLIKLSMVNVKTQDLCTHSCFLKKYSGWERESEWAWASADVPLFFFSTSHKKLVHSSKVSITSHRPMIPSYKNQSTDLPYMSIDWFLYNRNFGLKCVKITRPVLLW